MQKRKPGQPHKGWKAAASKAKQEVLGAQPRGYLRDWNFKLEQMPTEGEFEVMKIHKACERSDEESLLVVDTMTGRMFRPVAWRPAR